MRFETIPEWIKAFEKHEHGHSKSDGSTHCKADVAFVKFDMAPRYWFCLLIVISAGHFHANGKFMCNSVDPDTYFPTIKPAFKRKFISVVNLTFLRNEWGSFEYTDIKGVKYGATDKVPFMTIIVRLRFLSLSGTTWRNNGSSTRATGYCDNRALQNQSSSLKYNCVMWNMFAHRNRNLNRWARALCVITSCCFIRFHFWFS